MTNQQSQPQQPIQPMQAPQPQPQPIQPMQAPQPQPQPQPIQSMQAPQPQPMQPQVPQSLISFNTTAPETPSAFQTIIEQQQAQIDALMAQNAAQNAQIVQMVQGGAQFNQQQPQTPQVGQNWAVQPQQPQAYPPVYAGNDGMPLSLSADVDVSLESLAKEIGKKAE